MGVDVYFIYMQLTALLKKNKELKLQVFKITHVFKNLADK